LFNFYNLNYCLQSPYSPSGGVEPPRFQANSPALQKYTQVPLYMSGLGAFFCLKGTVSKDYIDPEVSGTVLYFQMFLQIICAN
jgi:hypothetical protein